MLNDEWRDVRERLVSINFHLNLSVLVFRPTSRAMDTSR
jgi:hypothetical protein